MSEPVPRGRIASGWALVVLFVTNVFNQGDRMLFGVVAEPIRKELRLSDTELALASGLFFVMFSLIGGVFIARLIDRNNRVRILAAGMTVWSLATAATGMADHYATLSLARIMVGIGEATAFPAAMSLIPDLFSSRTRGRAVSIYQSSNFVGIVGGTIIAGVLAATLGWRDMFRVCGIAGLAVVVLLLATVAEPPRQNAVAEADRSGYWADLVAGFARAMKAPGVVPLSIGLGFTSMMGAVLGAWGPAFLMRLHGVPLAQVGLQIGPPVGLGGIVGTVTSGFLADALVRRSERQETMLMISLVAVLLSLPFMAGFVFVPQLQQALVCAGLMNVLLSAAIPPIMNYLVSSIPANDRGVAATVILVVMGLVGGAVGPALVGMLSDALQAGSGEASLRYALSAMLASPLIAAALIFPRIQSRAR